MLIAASLRSLIERWKENGGRIPNGVENEERAVCRLLTDVLLLRDVVQVRMNCDTTDSVLFDYPTIKKNVSNLVGWYGSLEQDDERWAYEVLYFEAINLLEFGLSNETCHAVG